MQCRKNRAAGECYGDDSLVRGLSSEAVRILQRPKGRGHHLTFGFRGNLDGEKDVKGFRCYKTIAEGSGADPHWDGTSGAHTHMTNTRITDAEAFEQRYPFLLREFSLRTGSGGAGNIEAVMV